MGEAGAGPKGGSGPSSDSSPEGSGPQEVARAGPWRRRSLLGRRPSGRQAARLSRATDARSACVARRPAGPGSGALRARWAARTLSVIDEWAGRRPAGPHTVGGQRASHTVGGQRPYHTVGWVPGDTHRRGPPSVAPCLRTEHMGACAGAAVRRPNPSVAEGRLGPGSCAARPWELEAGPQEGPPAPTRHLPSAPVGARPADGDSRHG